MIPEAADAPASYAIRRHATGGGRKDILGLGEAQATTPYLHIEVYRPGNEIDAFADPATEIISRASNLGIADLRTSDQRLDSKFGPMLIVTFATRDVPRNCLGFAREFTDPRLEIVGWFCQGGPDMIERSTLSCALDRFTLLAAGSDPKVGILFARAEMRRSFCGQRDPILAATPKYKTLWAALPRYSDPKTRAAMRAYARQLP